MIQYMLCLLEDKPLIIQLVAQYLKDNTMQQWKFETLTRNIYQKEIIQYGNNHSHELTEAEKENIATLNDFISSVCTAKRIKTMVKEATFSSDYLQQLKDRVLLSAEQSQNQEHRQRQQQERPPFNTQSSIEKNDYNN